MSNPALDGCCPLKANCYEASRNTTNYYPGDCPNYGQCQATKTTLIDFEGEQSLDDDIDYWAERMQWGATFQGEDSP